MRRICGLLWLAAVMATGCPGGTQRVGESCTLDCEYCHGPGNCMGELLCAPPEFGPAANRTCQTHCHADKECAADEFCHFSTMDEYPDTCWARPKLGEKCEHVRQSSETTSADSCLAGLVCGLERKCLQVCTRQEECPSGTVCKPPGTSYQESACVAP